MGLRQTLNEKPALAGGVSAAILVLAIIIIVWQMRGSGSGPNGGRPAPVTQDYFTTDDGKNYFADSIDNIPPYKHEGKDAVRAFVFKCGSGAPFVAYLQKATESGRKQYAVFGHSSRVTAQTPPIFEVKKPGAGNQWVPVDNQHAREWRDITTPKCPNGQDSPSPVLPNQ